MFSCHLDGGSDVVVTSKKIIIQDYNRPSISNDTLYEIEIKPITQNVLYVPDHNVSKDKFNSIDVGDTIKY